MEEEREGKALSKQWRILGTKETRGSDTTHTKVNNRKFNKLEKQSVTNRGFSHVYFSWKSEA